MLMAYIKLDHAIRTMQKRGERLFRVRRESYRIIQKNAADRLSHAFPAMIVARWAGTNDYSSNRRADWNESKMCETKKRFDYHFLKRLSNFCPLSPLFPLPPFCPPLSPTTPITPYNPPNIFRAPPFPPRVFSASAGVICASARVDGAGCATIVQKWINNSYAKLQAGSFPLQPSISKTIPLASRADRKWELAWCSDWWMVCDYSRHGELTSFCSWLNM